MARLFELSFSLPHSFNNAVDQFSLSIMLSPSCWRFAIGALAHVLPWSTPSADRVLEEDVRMCCPGLCPKDCFLVFHLYRLNMYSCDTRSRSECQVVWVWDLILAWHSRSCLERWVFLLFPGWWRKNLIFFFISLALKGQFCLPNSLVHIGWV